MQMTDKAIQQYLYSLGEIPGVANSMAVISGTLEGKLSNLSDSSDGFKKAIGERLKPAIIFVVDKLKAFYDWGQKNLKILLPIVGVIGLFATALIGASVAAWINTVAQSALTKAIIKQNLALLTNPWTWVVIAIMVVIGVIYWLITAFEGWGKTWSNLMEYIKLSMSQMGAWAKLQMMEFVDHHIKAFDLIKIGWYKLQSLWDKDGGVAGIAAVEAERNRRADEIAKQRGKVEEFSKMRKEMTVWEVKRKKDSKDLKDVVSPAANTEETKQSNSNTGSAVASGGARSTSININIGKQVENMIFQGGFEENKEAVRKSVEEIMLRALYAAQSVG
jgi:hypothetical protein